MIVIKLVRRYREIVVQVGRRLNHLSVRTSSSQNYLPTVQEIDLSFSPVLIPTQERIDFPPLTRINNVPMSRTQRV